MSLGVLVCFAPLARPQSPDLRQILERLDKLERQNLELTQEVRSLRSQIAGNRPEAPPDVAAGNEPGTTTERLEVIERRMEEQAQTKVEAGSKLPVRLTGMMVVNAFTNGRFSGGNENPTTASAAPATRLSGGSVRQSTIGLEFDGSEILGGGKLSGSIEMDFFAGTLSTLNQLLRVRTASAQIDWKNTTLQIGQLKPIISPRDPTSLAQIGVSPLTSAGNLWLWLPQASVEHRFTLSEGVSLNAKVGVIQTNDVSSQERAGTFASTLARARPGLQGRFQFGTDNFQFAPGAHISRTHVAGVSLPSNVLSFDWLIRPVRKVEWTGFVFGGANMANMGTMRQGFTILTTGLNTGGLDSGRAIAIRGRGGWSQLALLPTERLSFHLMAGQHDDNNADLRGSGIAKNQAYAVNVMYRLAPNLILALEGSQIRTTHLPQTVRRNNHYDLAIGYLF